jgi:predicted nucleotidyltransferase
VDNATEITGILRDIVLIPADIPGIYLFGSLAEGRSDERSDIDICLVAGRDLDPVRLQSLAWQYLSSDRYDVRIFELLPLYLQIRILAQGILLSSPDQAALCEYLYPWWKRWDDQRWYQTPIPGAP